MTAPQSRPRVVTAAFWCWLVASILLIVGGLIAASVALPGIYRGAGVITALAGAGMAFLAGRSRSGDTRYRRAAVALSLAIVVLVALACGIRGGARAHPAGGHSADRRDRLDRPTGCVAVPPGAAVTETVPPPGALFHEQGASWWWLLAGPAAGVAMSLIQMSAGYGIQLLVPGIFFVLVTGFLAIQVKAARIHTSVELTPDHLRQGTERIRIDDIVRIYPEPKGPEEPKWQSARALGELTGVPRGRKGIGLKLTNDRAAQAWARKHQQLRAALTHLLEERIPPEPAS